MPTEKSTEPINEELEKKRREFQEEITHVKPAKKKPQKQSRKKLAFGLTLLGFLLVSLIGAAAYALWFSPERAVSDAIVRALASQTITFNGTLTAGNALNAQFNGASAGSQGARLSFNARLDFSNNTNTTSSDLILDKDGNLYMSAGGIQNALGKDLVADAANEGTYANLLLRKLEGKWLKITSQQLQPYSRKYANVQSCIETIIKKNQGSGPVFGEAAELYQKHKFIVVDKVLGNRGTSTGYETHLDRDALKAFLQEFKSTVLYRQLHDCDSATFDLNPDKFVKDLGGWFNKMELWVNQSHEITDIYIRGHLDSLAAELRITPQFNQEAKIIVPASTVSLDQLHSYLADGTMAMSLADKPDAQSRQLLETLKAKLETAQ